MGGFQSCCCTCLVAEDNFDRTDENPVTGSWTEIGGDWEILGNTLNCVTDGIIVTSARQPAPTASAYYATWHSVTIDSTGGVAEWHIITNFQTASLYDYIRIYADSGYYWPAFYKNGSLIMDKNTHPEVSGWLLESGKLNLKICVSTPEWSIQPTGSQGELKWQTCDVDVATALPVTTTYGLLGFKKGRFDDFYYEQHWEAKRSCPSCNCFCYISESDYSCIPEDLVLTLVPASGPYDWGFGSCPTPANIVINMYQQNPTTAAAPTLPVFGASRKTPRKLIWYSEVLMGEGAGPPIHGAFPWFILVCDTAFARAYLYVTEYPDTNIITPTITHSSMPNWITPESTIPNGRSKYYDLGTSTCIPLSLVFLSLNFPRGAVGQCDIYGTVYDVVITG